MTSKPVCTEREHIRNLEVTSASTAAELKMIKEDLKETKTDVKEIKSLVSSLPGKILAETDKKYVHKDSFDEFEKRFHEVNKYQDANITWNKSKVFDVSIKLASLGATVAVILKLMGLY